MGTGGQSHVPASLSPEERNGKYCKAGCLGPKASLDGCVKNEKSASDVSNTQLSQVSVYSFHVCVLITASM